MRMFQFAIVFFILALISAVFGFTGLERAAAQVGKFLFFLFVILFLLTLIFGTPPSSGRGTGQA